MWIYRVNNRGMKKKPSGSVEGVGEVSGRKWQSRLSSLSGFKNPLRVRGAPGFSNRAKPRVQRRRIPVFEDEDKVDTGSEPPFHYAK